MAMRAIRVSEFGGEENLKVCTDVAIPKPSDDEVLIEVKAAGVNPVDTYIRRGTYDGAKVPYVPGRDCAGIIKDVGSTVKGFHKGDRVISIVPTSGAYAEYCTSKQTNICPLHKSLTFEQGAAIGIPNYTAYGAIHFKANAQPGETVLVHGASGAVGIAAVQILKAMGCRVIGTAGTPEGMKLVKDQGADFVFNHRDKDHTGRILTEVTEGQGVNVILEMLADVNLQADMEIMAWRGRTVVIGNRGATEVNARLLMKKESMIMGMMLGGMTPEEWKVMHAGIAAGQASGWLKPHVGRVYSLAEAGKAQYDVINNQGTQGKLVIDVTK